MTIHNVKGLYEDGENEDREGEAGGGGMYSGTVGINLN